MQAASWHAALARAQQDSACQTRPRNCTGPSCSPDNRSQECSTKPGLRNMFLNFHQGPIAGIAMLRLVEVNLSVSIHWKFRPQACARMPATSCFGQLCLSSPSLDLEGHEHSISQVSILFYVRTGIRTYSKWSFKHFCCNSVREAVSSDMCWFQLWHFSNMPLVRMKVCCRTCKANGMIFML